MEPLHIHARKGDTVAKFWLEPVPSVAEAYGMSPHELAELLNVAIEKIEGVRRYWNEHFGI